MAIPAIAGIIGSAAGGLASGGGGTSGGVSDSIFGSKSKLEGIGPFMSPHRDFANVIMSQRDRQREEERYRQALELEKIRAGLIQQQTGQLKDARSDRQLFRNAMLGI